MTQASTVVAIGEPDTALAVPALQVLWPRYSAEEMCRFIDGTLRPNGYHLVGIIPPGSSQAAAVLGYRLQHSLWLGRSLYIVDVATLPEWRGKGFADQLAVWSEAEALKLGCDAIHLDSGVGVERSAAHRLYMRHHYRIACHHFAKQLR